MEKINQRLVIRCLYNIVKDDVQITTGSNIITFLLSTWIDPRFMNRHYLKTWLVLYPSEDNWRVPLLTSLLELRAGNWELTYDDEEDSLQDDEVDFMIAAVSSG